MEILWILLPSPFVGYLIIDTFRRAFSEDETVVRRLFAAQPVTMLAGAMALGSVAVWAISEIVLRFL